MTFAFVFPGQGSQSVGMMQAYDGLPAIRETFQEASDALGQDLWALAEEGPAENLNQTVNTQPVMLAAGIAVFRAWRQLGGRMPALMAGHSFGEYSALVASGALGFRDALPLVRYRAEAIQDAGRKRAETWMAELREKAGLKPGWAPPDETNRKVEAEEG